MIEISRYFPKFMLWTENTLRKGSDGDSDVLCFIFVISSFINEDRSPKVKAIQLMPNFLNVKSYHVYSFFAFIFSQQKLDTLHKSCYIKKKLQHSYLLLFFPPNDLFTFLISVLGTCPIYHSLTCTTLTM